MLRINASLFSLYDPVDLNDELWDRLQGGREGKLFEKKAFLAVQEQPVKELIALRKGRVKAAFLSAAGGEIIFEILDAPAVFGYQALYGGRMEQWYPNLVALRDSEAVFIPLGEVEDLIEDEPALLKCFFQCLRVNVTTASRLQFWSRRLNLLQKVASPDHDGNLPGTRTAIFL